jgi:hypothetical protein
MTNVCLVQTKIHIRLMGLFNQQIRFIQSLEREFFVVLERIIEANNLVIKDYIVDKQLFQKGIDGNKKRLKGYKRTTIRYKLSKGQPVDRTTLKDSGTFHASITIKAYKDRFEISSDVNHAKYLVARDGKDIMRPTDENMNEFMRKYFIPQLKQKHNGKFAK